MQVVWIQVMEYGEFMRMLYWLVRPIKQTKNKLKKTKGISLAALQQIFKFAYFICILLTGGSHLAPLSCSSS